MSKTILITSVGWEPRFQLGLKRTLENTPNISEILYLHPIAFRSRTESILTDTKKSLSVFSCIHTCIDIDPGNHVTSWRAIQKALSHVQPEDKVILDMTTMPRQIIWACLHFLDHAKVEVKSIYYRPKTYGKWLSGDNGKPKLLFRHSGIAYPDRPTCLLLFTGFDLERTNQIVEAFEPAKVILIAPSGDQLNNTERCVNSITGRAEILISSLDAYSDITKLRNDLISLISNDTTNFNVIATTMGPRCSAAALYLLNKSMPEVGLSYASSHLYNESYSSGIDYNSKFESTIDFS
jgi:hypothetical protein